MDGTFLNNWSSPADYTATGWAPYDEALIKNVSMTMTKTTVSGGDYVFTDGSGSEIKGIYTVDSKNNIIFDKDINFSVSDWVSLSTTADKSLRIIRSQSDLLGNVTDLWLGKRDADSEEYLVYHFELGSSDEGATTGTELTFDPSKIVFGDIEGNGNLRIEVYNAYGSTSTNPPLSKDEIIFASKLEITFTLSGITLNTGASTSYDASMYFANVNWSPSGNGTKTQVTGNGTYTVSFTGTSAVSANVVVVDIVSLMDNVADTDAVKAVVDKIIVQ